MFKSFKYIFRLCRIAYVLARHDALFPLERLDATPFIIGWARLIRKRKSSGRPGERLAQAFIDLGPSFIKLGQILSVRSDIIGQEVAEDLSLLQDKLPAFSIDNVKETIKDELGEEMSSLYSFFDETPVAAASISQVHKAQTIEGNWVAVKVLRPNIEKIFNDDIGLFYWIAKVVEKASEQFHKYRPTDIAKVAEQTIKIELDLRMEAAAAEELAENFYDNPNYNPPEIYWDLTTKRVMTTEWIDGISIDEREKLVEAGFNTNDILKNSAESFFYQVYRDGFFHADMHGGNAFVTKEGAIAPVDFGMMGRLDKETRGYLAELMLALVKGDYLQIAKVHRKAGYLPEEVSDEVFMQASRSIAAPIVGKSSKEISYAKFLGQMFQIMETFDIYVQPQLLMLQKTMLMAEGMGQVLNPNVNIWDLARPLIEEWMKDNYGPEAQLADRLSETIKGIQSIPAFLDNSSKIINQMAHEKTLTKEYILSKQKQKTYLNLFLLLLAFLGGSFTTYLTLFFF